MTAIRDKLSVSSAADASSTKGYLDTRGPDGRPLNLALTFWEVTNAAQVNAGVAMPQFAPRGPYVWTEQKKKLNVEFLEDGDAVKYVEHTEYVWSAALSAPNVTENDVITMVNPFNIGAKLLLERNQTIHVAVIGLRLASAFQTGAAAATAAGVAAANVPRTVAAQLLPGVDPNVALAVLLGGANALVNAASPATGIARVGEVFRAATAISPCVTATGLSTVDDRTCPAVATAEAAIRAAVALWPALGVSPSDGTTVLPLSASGMMILSIFQSLRNLSPLNPTNPASASRLAQGDVVSRPARVWAFGGQLEPLIAQILMLSSPQAAAVAQASAVGLFSNLTEAQALAANRFHVVRTGAKKARQGERGQYTTYGGVSTVSDYAVLGTPAFPVAGTGGSVFGFKSSTDDPKRPLTVFVSQMMRPFNLIRDRTNSSSPTSYMGIDTYKLRLDPRSLAKDPKFNVIADGVVRTDTLSTNPLGIPFILTKPRFLDTDPALNLTALLPADQRAPNRPRDDLVLYFEPFTGLVLRGALRLQLSLQVPMGPNPTNWTGSAFVPLVSVDEFGGINPQDALDLRDALNRLKFGIVILPAFLMGIGGAVFFFAIWWLLKGLTKKEYVSPPPMVDPPKDFRAYVTFKIRETLRMNEGAGGKKKKGGKKGKEGDADDGEGAGEDQPFLYENIPQFHADVKNTYLDVEQEVVKTTRYGGGGNKYSALPADSPAKHGGANNLADSFELDELDLEPSKPVSLKPKTPSSKQKP